MSSRLPTASFALVGAAVVLLSGCAAFSSVGSGVGTSATPGAENPAADPAPEPATDPAQSADCLIGDWYIENDEMQGFYDALATSVDGGVSFDISGGTGLSFTATDYTYTPEFELKLSVSGLSGTGVITGEVTGDYTAADGVITTAFEESNVALTVKVGGVTQDGTELFGDILRSAPINSAPFECTPAGPIIGLDTGGDRHSVQLTPRS